MTPTKDCLDLIKSFEGCKLAAYQDSVGVWTIGWGHIAGVMPGQTCTQDEADAWLAEEVQHAQDQVLRLVTTSLTPGQLGALTSFAYNLGAGALGKSTLLKLVNARDWKDAASEFPKWSFAGGKFVDGLMRRRLAEEALFLKGV